MENSNLLHFVIVGHIDHGKSTLIGRLLYDTNSLPADRIEDIKKTSEGLGRDTEFAYLLDHLEEERQQGVTIDTTQVFFKTDRRQYVIIDAPGHVEFVKNMITGASQAEGAVLIVDIKEGVKEQTKRHAYLLSLIGLKQVIVVLNKMDLAGFKEENFKRVKGDIEEFLKSIGIRPIIYIPICAIKGDNITKKSGNMKWYDGPTLLESLDFLKSSQSAETGSLIMPIQDAYKVDNERILAGRIERGLLQKGQTIKVLPSGESTVIKSVEKYLSKTDRASAGESIGFTTTEATFIDRGNVICCPGQELVSTDTFSANIFWMSKKEFHKGERITIRCATQETKCRIEKIEKRIDSSSLEVLAQDADVLRNLEVGEVTIKTKRPIVIETFAQTKELGRFVLVRDENICAGGIITNIKKS